MAYYDQAEAKLASVGQAISNGAYIPPTDRQKLEDKKHMLLFELDRVEKALQALDAHPDLEEFTKVLAAALR